MSHNFHFVLSNELREKIINFSAVQNKNYSQTIVYIFNVMKPVLTKHFFVDSKCDMISNNAEKADMNLHVKLENKDYNFLKQIHSNFQTYSMAVLLRWMLYNFFNGLNRYGIAKFLKMMKKYYMFFLKNIKKTLKINNKISKNIKTQTTQKLIGKHMFTKIQHNKYISINLSENFELISFEFI